MAHKSGSSARVHNELHSRLRADAPASPIRLPTWLPGIATRIPHIRLRKRADVKRTSKTGLAVGQNLLAPQQSTSSAHATTSAISKTTCAISKTTSAASKTTCTTPKTTSATSKLYREAAFTFAALLAITLIAGNFCFEQTFLIDRLLPVFKSLVPWQAAATSDADNGGNSIIRINDAAQSLDYTFTASSTVAHSYASVSMNFWAEASPLVDLSKYSTLRFNVKCSPHNVLSFTAHTLDKSLSAQSGAPAYRIPAHFFACEQEWTPVEIDLKHLEIPEWWLNLHNIPLSDRHYDLARVSGFTFGMSVQSPRDVASSVKIVELELVGRDWRYLYVFAIFAGIIWLGYGFWFFKKHAHALVADLQEQMQKDRPLIAYQQLSVEPHKDKEKSAVLRYMATEYANPDISLDTAINAIGINRAKMNSILKDEIGLTFSAYLNKLRLTEAARLLAEKPEANVAEIAFSVGYNNVSYFNKLFKNEYGHSPKTFKSVLPDE
jgi:AraC-like DNA-binding protein